MFLWSPHWLRWVGWRSGVSSPVSTTGLVAVLLAQGLGNFWQKTSARSKVGGECRLQQRPRPQHLQHTQPTAYRITHTAEDRHTGTQRRPRQAKPDRCRSSVGELCTRNVVGVWFFEKYSGKKKQPCRTGGELRGISGREGWVLRFESVGKGEGVGLVLEDEGDPGEMEGPCFSRGQHPVKGCGGTGAPGNGRVLRHRGSACETFR